MTEENRTLLVNVRLAPDAAAIARSSASLYVDLRGTIELLTDQSFVTIGQFEDAVFLVPDLASIANGIARMREGGLKIAVELIESPPLWFVRKPRDRSNINIEYAGQVIRGLAIEGVDAAFADAVLGFFMWLNLVREGRPIDTESLRELETTASVWSAVDPIVRSWGRRASKPRN
jgi:hypothetical protein